MSGQLRNRGVAGPLSAAQRRMVEENMGLVAVHIRRRVSNVGVARCDRNYDDLFQEGCFGLIDAARRFDGARGIPFAAFALPRIHTAVSSALWREGSTGRKPRSGGVPGGVPSGRFKRSAAWGDCAGVTVRQIDLELDDRPSPRVGAGLAGAGGVSIGDRLREKYDLAVDAATRGLRSRAASRKDPSDMVGHVVEHRLRVPEPSAKTGLRQIARDTGTSYARVRRCEMQLNRNVRRALVGDLEFRRLLELAKDSAEGPDEPIDPAVAEELRRLDAEAFWRKLNALDEEAQVAVWKRLMLDAGESLGPVIKRWFAALARETADKLVSLVNDGR